MNERFKMYGITNQNTIDILTRDDCWADSRLGKINLFDLSKKYFNGDKNLPNYIIQWTKQGKFQHYLINFVSDAVKWSKKYWNIMIGYDIDPEKVREWYCDDEPIKIKYEPYTLVIATKSFEAIISNSLGEKILTTIKINKGDIFAYKGQKKSKYKLLKQIPDEIKYDDSKVEYYSYKHLFEYYTEITTDHGSKNLYICLEDPNCFAKLSLDKYPKINTEFYIIDQNYYGEKMEVQTGKIKNYISLNKKLYIETSLGSKEFDKNIIWDKSKAEKLCAEKNISKPIIMKKSDIELYKKGFDLYQYGICAEHPTEEDKEAERKGSDMIDKALAPYKGYIFNSDQKNIMQTIDVNNKEAYKQVNIIIKD